MGYHDRSFPDKANKSYGCATNCKMTRKYACWMRWIATDGVCGGEHFAIANNEIGWEGIVTSKDKQEWKLMTRRCNVVRYGYTGYYALRT